MFNIKVFDITDNSLYELGLALRNKNCRKIILLLIDERLPVSQISKRLNMGMNIASDQVKLLKSLGLLKITTKPIAKKGVDHYHYQFNTDIFISAIKKENKMTSIFKESAKFASIITAGTMTFFSLFREKINFNREWSRFSDSDYSDILFISNVFQAITYSLIVVIAGLVILYLSERKKRR